MEDLDEAGNKFSLEGLPVEILIHICRQVWFEFYYIKVT
jgi:hypothetical protein